MVPDKGATVTFLLRNDTCFDNDEALQRYIKSGKARLVKGDAMISDDVKKALNTAISDPNTHLDTIIFTVGKL
jgi:hypothetical protein